MISTHTFRQTLSSNDSTFFGFGGSSVKAMGDNDGAVADEEKFGLLVGGEGVAGLLCDEPMVFESGNLGRKDRPLVV